MALPSTLTKYDFYLGPKSLGDAFTLKRGALPMRCALSTHRLGWELRLTAGSNFLRSHVCRSASEVTSVSEAWEAEAKKQGWS